MPTIPAYLLFKALPASRGSVEGKLQGLEIKLGGAFAGYFALVLLVLYTHKIWAPAPAYEAWEAVGTITDDQGPLKQISPANLNTSPKIFTVDDGAIFHVTFVGKPAPSGEGVQYPTLTINIYGYQELSVPLDPAKLKEAPKEWGAQSDESKRQINFNSIRLKKANIEGQ